jgi:subtilisin family serine protease
MATSRGQGRSNDPSVIMLQRLVSAALLASAAALLMRHLRRATPRVVEGPLYMPGEVLLTFTAPRDVTADDARLSMLVDRAADAAGMSLQRTIDAPRTDQMSRAPATPAARGAARAEEDTGQRDAAAAPRAQHAHPPHVVRTAVKPSGLHLLRHDHVKRATTRINDNMHHMREAEVAMASAMPNWIIGSGSGGSGRPIGGPGTVPDLAPDGGWTIAPPPGLAGPAGAPLTAVAVDSSLDGQVIVAVLDTSPGPDALLRAARKYPQNWLLKRLTADGTDANAVISEWNTFAPPNDVPKWPSNSEVDHGIFVSGIIHSLAPRARIHLLHVLDNKGRGRTDLLLEALHHCLTLAQQGHRVVVNLSLYLLIPPGEEHWARWFGPMHRLSRATPATKAKLLASLDAAVRQAITLLLDAGVVVVAAAGNDALIYARPPQPRVPADYPGVLCVVAADREGKRASYSNEGEIPATGSCVAAYGGQGKLVNQMVGDTVRGKVPVVPPGTDPRDGVVGVYCSDTMQTVDGLKQNDCGWAYWSGTSFATPMVSALAANILAQNERDRQADPSVARLTPHAVIGHIVGMGAASPDSTLHCPLLRFEQTS